MILNKEDINKCITFSREIIEKENQYQRIKEPEKIRIFRTFLGKLSEIYIHKYSYYLNGNLDNFKYDRTMFEIFNGQKNVDISDFVYNGESIDIKTLYANNHKNIFIPVDQTIKDIYLGVKIKTKRAWTSDDFHNGKSTKWEENIKNFIKDIVDFECVGYIRKNILTTKYIKNYGNDAYFMPLAIMKKDGLMEIIKNIETQEMYQQKMRNKKAIKL